MNTHKILEKKKKKKMERSGDRHIIDVERMDTDLWQVVYSLLCVCMLNDSMEEQGEEEEKDLVFVFFGGSFGFILSLQNICQAYGDRESSPESSLSLKEIRGFP
uniref:Uncharacterized protein n=1 Tax=Caenorhabditis tropicalis TaxID=1561998 RepID=A0A1I7TEE0_9PELO